MSIFPFLVVGLLLGLSDGLVSPDNLKKLSEEGSKYISDQFENALDGVKQMKLIMDKTGEEHQEIMRSLEETKRKKEEAVKRALESEQQLAEKNEICNETMLALWEECKPCLKQTCVQFYTKTCRSGSGLVGRQFEEYLNRTSPFSIFVNGERLDTLAREDQEQYMTLEDLEDGYSIVEDSVDEIFKESMKAFQNMQSLFPSPFLRFGEPQRGPFPFPSMSFPLSSIRIRKERSPLFEPYFPGNFQSLFEAAQKMMERRHQLMQQQMIGGKLEGTGNTTDDKVVCRELRRNSAGCLKMRDKCEKCKEILAIDCSGKDQMQRRLQEKFEDSVHLAEEFTKKYDELLQNLRDRMLNSTSLFENLNKQFGWVSKLANLTQIDKNSIFQVSTVYSKSTIDEVPSNTTVTVKVFDSEPITFTVPGNIEFEDPKFGELVAEEALKRFQKEIIEAA
ncbi:clusterin [Discoglossus pictus]